MKVHESVINNDILSSFSDPRGNTLFVHAHNVCNMEMALGMVGVFCPEIIQVKDYIFIKEFYNGGIESLESEFWGDKKKIEMFVNSWSLTDICDFLANDEEKNEKLVIAFGEAVKYFWNHRFKELFPTKDIVIETDYEINGERGLTIVVYQR